MLLMHNKYVSCIGDKPLKCKFLDITNIIVNLYIILYNNNKFYINAL